MVTTADLKAELLRLIEQLDKERLIELLDTARWLLDDDGGLTEDERREIEEGFKEIERGESISLDEFLRSTSD